MNARSVFSIVIVCDHPFVSPSAGEEVSLEEQIFFETLSETWIPLLEVFNSLEKEGIPFRFGLVVSPSLCAMFQSEVLSERYLLWLEKRIEFGSRELRRCNGTGNSAMKSLAAEYLGRDCRRRELFTETYRQDLLGSLLDFQKKGRVEFLLAPATDAFLPFYVSMEEAIRSQIETALIHYRKYLGKTPAGFWLPEFGWTGELGPYLAEYGFTYTIASAHALVLGSPPAERGSYFPVKSPSGMIVFAQDNMVERDFQALRGQGQGVYQSPVLDAGFELPAKAVKVFLGSGSSRLPTGYRYWTEDRKMYDPTAAAAAAAAAAGTFLDRQIVRLEEAQSYLEHPALSLWAVDANLLGRSWHEGMSFLEALVKEINRREAPRFFTPLEYLTETHHTSFQALEPEYSSALKNGYGEVLLDASNDWIYRHIFRSVQRMAEMTERFSIDTGLKERALNQAARELLLAESAGLSKPLNPQYQSRLLSREYAEKELEGALRNFTTIYESLGSGHISTEWLTALEKRHFLLPYISHRVFGKKH